MIWQLLSICRIGQSYIWCKSMELMAGSFINMWPCTVVAILIFIWLLVHTGVTQRKMRPWPFSPQCSGRPSLQATGELLEVCIPECLQQEMDQADCTHQLLIFSLSYVGAVSFCTCAACPCLFRTFSCPASFIVGKPFSGNARSWSFFSA